MLNKLTYMTNDINKYKMADLDKIDEKILSELVDNAKIPLRELGMKVGVSFVTVMNHIKSLEKEGIIQGYCTKINYDKLGYDIHTLVEIRISKGKLFELEKKIAKLPNVYAVYDTTGEFDATILAKFKNTRQMDSFVKQIQTYDFVERTNTKLILNTIKEKSIRL